MASPLVYLAFTDGKRRGPGGEPDGPEGDSGGSVGRSPVEGPGILNELIPEFQGIQNVFAGLPSMTLHPRLADVTVENMIGDLKKHGDRIVIFHYGGHGADDTLVLESDAPPPARSADGNGDSDRGGDAAHAGGLARILGRLPNLRLVVLNGCGTVALKDALIEAGVPAVIATSADIRDESAREFAVEFYGYLTERRSGKISRFFGRRTLSDAFSEATDEKGAKGLDVRTKPHTRGAAGPEAAAATAPIDHWGLYYEDKQIRSWRLLHPRNWRLRGRAKRWSLPVRAPTPALWGLLTALLGVWLLRAPLFPQLSGAGSLLPYAVPAGLLIVMIPLPLLAADTYRRAYNGLAVLLLAAGVAGGWYYHGTTILRLVLHPEAIQHLEIGDETLDAALSIGGQVVHDFALEPGQDVGALLLGGWTARGFDRRSPLVEEHVREAAKVAPEVVTPDGADGAVRFEAQMLGASRPVRFGPVRLEPDTRVVVTLASEGFASERACTPHAPAAEVGRWPRIRLADCFAWERADG